MEVGAKSKSIGKYNLGEVNKNYIVSFARKGRDPLFPDLLKVFPGIIKSPTVDHIFDCEVYVKN